VAVLLSDGDSIAIDLMQYNAATPWLPQHPSTSDWALDNV